MKIGAHESIAGGVSKAFARAQDHGGRALQIFTKNARGWSAPALSRDEASAFRREAKRTGLTAFAHGSYLVNFASDEPGIRERSIACAIDELRRADRLGVPYVVYHPGSHVDERTGIRLIAQAADEVLRAARTRTATLCFEGTAGQGNCIGWRLEHLAELLSASTLGDRIGICLDTCHLFAAGYDLRTRRKYEAVMDQVEATIGTARVRCFHLNDSKRPLGSRVDRHASLGDGELGWAPFRYLVNDPRFKDTLAVLETPAPERYAETIAHLNSFARI